jgi:hypothetical protein
MTLNTMGRRAVNNRQRWKGRPFSCAEQWGEVNSGAWLNSNTQSEGGSGVAPQGQEVEEEREAGTTDSGGKAVLEVIEGGRVNSEEERRPTSRSTTLLLLLLLLRV